jgi:hypothetical protein
MRVPPAATLELTTDILSTFLSGKLRLEFTVSPSSLYFFHIICHEPSFVRLPSCSIPLQCFRCGIAVVSGFVGVNREIIDQFTSRQTYKEHDSSVTLLYPSLSPAIALIQTLQLNIDAQVNTENYLDARARVKANSREQALSLSEKHVSR